MSTAVVILNWNTEDLLRRFLPPLLESVAGRDAAVIVADNASSDGSVAMLREAFPAVRVIALDRNYGFAEGYDRALTEVDADYFVLLNSDIEVSPGWLDPLTAYMDAHPDCAACGPKLHSWYDRDRFEYAGAAGGLLDRYGYPFCRGRVLQRTEADTGQYDTVRDVLWASGACLIVRSAVFRALGGLDRRFFAHMEEIDLCWRMQLAGHRVTIVPAATVYHLGGATLPPSSPWKLQLNYRNNLLMLDNCLARTLALRYGAAAGVRRSACVIFFRQVLDGCSAIVYLCTGRLRYFRAVLRAHREFRLLRHGTSQQEAEAYLRAHGDASVKGIYGGWILPRALLRGDRIFDLVHKL